MTGKRDHTLGIWALTLGYYLFYVPYSGISKAVTSGLVTGGQSIPGAELLYRYTVVHYCQEMVEIWLSTPRVWLECSRPKAANVDLRTGLRHHHLHYHARLQL